MQAKNGSQRYPAICGSAAANLALAAKGDTVAGLVGRLQQRVRVKIATKPV